MKEWFKTINRQNIQHEDLIIKALTQILFMSRRDFLLQTRILADKEFSLINNSFPCYRLLAPRKYVPASLRKIATVKKKN